ncbi:MAG: opioid growth factor receptor-related protein [Gemmataceae bacterium]
MDFVKFYLGTTPDYLGRKLQALWRLSDEDLETGHDFIQVLFPLPERSQAIPGAPVIDEAALAEFRDNATIQANLLRSFERMLNFYGFKLDKPRKEVAKADDFRRKAENWLFPNDHNHLRITRMMKCLRAVGLGDYAAAFYRALAPLADPKHVTAETLRYWQTAADVTA